jgi:hypothetical protein
MMKPMKTKIFLSLLIILTLNVFAQVKTDYNKKIACFYAKDFPTVDAPKINESTLKQVLSSYDAEYFTDVKSLNEKLSISLYNLLILPYGSAFPLDAWNAIRSFLDNGGSLVYLGGYPFHQPVIWKESSWINGTPQPSFAQQLYIGPSDKITLNQSDFYSNTKIVAKSGFDAKPEDLVKLTDVYEMTVQFTNKGDLGPESYSGGQRQATMRPLVQIENENGLSVACPVSEIDYLQGRMAGARWIIAPSNAELSSSILEKIVKRAMQGAVELNVSPVFASLYKDETPQIRINLFKPDCINSTPVKINIVVKNNKNEIVFSDKTELTGIDKFKTATVMIKTSKPLMEGFYSTEIIAEDNSLALNKSATGFWIWDNKLAGSAPVLSTSKDWILKDGKTFPIVGTTYMSSDVHRKFLFEPNPFVWDQDFQVLQKLGVNFIRTGLWTGWSLVTTEKGNINESFLRAVDAFVLTAAKYNVFVCFNIFAFSPPTNGGTNPYLDPQALDWQKTFVTILSKRYKNVGWINYDLINEPSYAPTNNLWKNIPVGDSYERDAWKDWVTKKLGNNVSVIQDKWRDVHGDVFNPPAFRDLFWEMYRDNRRPRKGMDFNLFTQDVAKNWAQTLNNAIKANSSALVTLGQDEGGTEKRPAPQFFYPAVDYTAVHTWWLNNNVLWDQLMTKVPEKPNLTSETGLMRFEDTDGETLRSQQKAHNLLERKYGLAFAGRACGAVEWVYNINPFLGSPNECVIGFVRPDGTAKEEIQVLKKFSEFFEAAKTKLKDFHNSEVVMIIPYSRFYSATKNTDLSLRRFVRTLSDHFGITPSLLSEYDITEKRLQGAKLIIVPFPEFLDDACATQIYNVAQKGIKVLFTGPITGNAYGELTEPIKKLGLNNQATSIELLETVTTEQGKYVVTFDNQQNEFIKKSAVEKFYTNGNIMHEPLPLELAREEVPLIVLLKNIFKNCGVQTQYTDTPLTTSIFYTDENTFVVCVNESSADIERKITVDNKPLRFNVEAGKTKMLLVERSTGKILVETK